MRALVGGMVVLGVVGCGGGEATRSDGGTESVDAGAPGPDATPLDPIPEDTIPCEEPAWWPLELASTVYPLRVHYRAPPEEATAAEVLDYLETSWQVEVDQLGFRPPLPDPGVCGPDEAFDVFLWRGIESAYVDAMADNPATAWDDWFTYMVVDAWGPYGGAILDSTIAHEFNHACQASDDWWDAPIVFEMTAVFVEELVFDEDDEYKALLADFQARPEWALDRDDGYETWYMYGSALYLHYLRDRFFDGDGAFAADMWLRLRNPPDAGEPDFEDALDEILDEAAGVSFLDSAVEFARWRWYTGARDDGAHFEEGATFPEDATVRVAAVIDTGSLPDTVELSMMALGSAYVDVPASAAGATLAISVEEADPDVDWVVQILPGLTAGSDGTVLDLSGGPADVPGSAPRTIVVTALPLPEDADPDDRTDVTYGVTLRIDAAP